MSEHAAIDVIIRTSLIFIYTFLILRLTGRHQLTQLTLFDFLIVIALGSAVGDAMIYSENTVKFTHSMIAIAVVAAIHLIIIKISERNYFMHSLLYGKPRLLIKDGKMIEKNIRKEDLTREDMMSLIREEGVGDLKRVKYAYLEPAGGKVSVIKRR